jgi:hypothetical protein
MSKKIELRPLISGFDFALLEVRNLCVASRLSIQHNAVSELLYPTMKAEHILHILHWYGRDFKTLWVML